MLLNQQKSHFASTAYSIPGMKLLCCCSISMVRIYQCNCSVKLFQQTPVNLEKAFCPSEESALIFLLFDNLMNHLQWTTFFLSDHIKISPCCLWNKFIWPFTEDLFCYTANLYQSLEWSLIRYVYSFNKDVLSSWMCAKSYDFPSPFLPNSMKLLNNFWHIVFCHYVWPECIQTYVIQSLHLFLFSGWEKVNYLSGNCHV